MGLDIGVTTGGAIIWAVFTDTDHYAGMLAGTYAGASGEVSIAAGLGANVLVGGSISWAFRPPAVLEDRARCMTSRATDQQWRPSDCSTVRLTIR